MTRTKLPEGPWQHLAADLLGPLPNGQYVFVIVDYFSRFTEVRFMRSIKSTDIIKRLDQIFSVHGYPISLKTDNAPNFVSDEFKKYLESADINHVTSIPLWPQSNGEVERQNRTLLKYLKIANLQRKDLQSELQKFLMAYRTTPHSITGIAPAEMLFKRKVKSKLPEIQLPQISDLEADLDADLEEVEARDSQKKKKEKNTLIAEEEQATATSVSETKYYSSSISRTNFLCLSVKNCSLSLRDEVKKSRSSRLAVVPRYFAMCHI